MKEKYEIETIDNQLLMQSNSNEMSEILVKVFHYFARGMGYSTQAQEQLSHFGINHKIIELGFDNGLFFAKANELLKNQYVALGLLEPSPIKRDGFRSYFKNHFVFPLYGVDSHIVGFWGSQLFPELSHKILLEGVGCYPAPPSPATSVLIVCENPLQACLIQQINFSPTTAVVSIVRNTHNCLFD